MTRFARAKGSKSSNERVPEDATSWQEMKHQLEQKKQEQEDNVKRKEIATIRNAKYEQFLAEVEDAKEVKWAEFQEEPLKKKKKMNNHEAKSNVLIDDTIKSKSKKRLKSERINHAETSVVEGKTKEKEQDEDGNDSDGAPVEVSAKIKPIAVASKPKPQQKIQIKVDAETVKSKKILTPKEFKKLRKKERQKLKKINTAPVAKKPVEELTEAENKKLQRQKDKRIRQAEKRRQARVEKKLAKLEANQLADQPNDKGREQLKQKVPKVKCNRQNDSKEIKQKLPKVKDGDHIANRKKVKTESINISGAKVGIAYIGGFPVKQEDARRLLKLKTELRHKGYNKHELDRALKAERRKAERALSKEKKKVCFNCRISGHDLSQCPQLEGNPNVQIFGTDICYKCGSTEHKPNECKVRGDDFKYATCFICKEQGHISRQCPDNPRGIYPKGGACKICGDVTHLKKDCPKFREQQESDNVTLDTMTFDSVDTLGHEETGGTTKISKSKKVVKF